MQLITKEELAELIFENKEGMYRLAYTIVENDADAQDAVGDAIVMELKEEFREVIILYYYEEFSVGEISKMLKIPTGTVKSRLARGRDKLSTIL